MEREDGVQEGGEREREWGEEGDLCGFREI